MTNTKFDAATQQDAQPEPVSVADPMDLSQALLVKRDKIVQHLAAIDAEVAALQQELGRKMEEARERRAPLEEALSHLDALLRIEGWVPPVPVSGANHYGYASNSLTPIEAAHDLLSQLGKPIHYRELAQKLIDVGVYVSGKNPAATLLSQMTRDSRFRRAPERGVYGLATWKMRTPKRVKRKRRSAKRA